MRLHTETRQLQKAKKTRKNTSWTAPRTAHATIEISPQEPCAVESRLCARRMQVLGTLNRAGRSDSCGNGGDSGGLMTEGASTAGSTTVGTDCAPRWGTRRCSLNQRILIPLDQTACRLTIEQSSSGVREYWRSRASQLYGRVQYNRSAYNRILSEAARPHLVQANSPSAEAVSPSVYSSEVGFVACLKYSKALLDFCVPPVRRTRTLFQRHHARLFAPPPPPSLPPSSSPPLD